MPAADGPLPDLASARGQPLPTWRTEDPVAFLSPLAARPRQVPPPPGLGHSAKETTPPASKGLPATAGACGVLGLVVAALGRSAQARATAAGRRQSRLGGLGRSRTTLCAVGDSGGEAERMFREAYEAENERALLLKQQLEAALTAKLQADGDAGVKITVDAESAPLSPEEEGGKSTWREAYEAVKMRASNLEAKLKKATSMGTQQAAPPPPAAPAAAATGSGAAIPAEPVTTEAPKTDNVSSGPFGGFMDPATRDKQGFQKLEDLAQTTIDDEATLRLIAMPILGRRVPGESTAVLPPVSMVQETIGNDQFSISETIEFSRVYVMKGAVVKGVQPSDALERLQSRLASKGYGDSTEIFLQKSKEEGRSLVFVMLKEDLPQNEFAWWQWALCAVLFLATIASVNITTFSVMTVNQMSAPTMDMEQATKIALKTIPTAVAIFTTVASGEAARRLAASKYDVELTPPFFIPVWPFPSVGSFGAVTRRLGTVPNEDASVSMSVAATLTGYAVSFLFLLYGLSQGPDPDSIVNLNFQLLPLLLKLVLKPVLGQSSVSDQPDPFADPVSIAFPANPWTIGGIIGLIVVSLNLLPVGRLDGGILAKSVLGGRISGLLGVGTWTLVALGALAPNDAGLLYIAFGFFALAFQSGSESPPRDSVTELDGTLKALASVLVVSGVALSLPGAILPNL